jgi:hypothetical protein
MSDSEVASKLAAILARPEFQPDIFDHLGVKLRRAVDAFQKWLDALGPVGRWGFSLAAFAFLLAILIHLGRSYREALAAPVRGALRPEPSGPVTRPSAASLATLARGLAEAGRLREAARALQQAVLVALCARAGLAWSPSPADWEWMRVLGARPGLQDFTQRAQAIAFGARPTREAFEECWERSRHWLDHRLET